MNMKSNFTIYKLRILLSFSILFYFSQLLKAQQTYYYQSGSPHQLLAWNSQPNGNGTTPTGFHQGDSFIMSSNTQVTLTHYWSMGGQNAVLLVDSLVTFTLAADFQINSGAELIIKPGALVKTDTFELRGAGNLQMLGGSLELGKLNVVLPMLTGNYQLLGGEINLTGSGNQIVRGSRSYHQLTFSADSGVKTFTSAITGTNSIRKILISGANTLDQENRSIGNQFTDVEMTKGLWRLAGNGTKPDAAGNYQLTGGCIEWYGGSSVSSQNIRSGISYACILVNSPFINPSNGNISLANNGIFRILPHATWNMTNGNVGISGSPGSKVFVEGTFKVYHQQGLRGSNFTAVRNSVDSLIFDSNATVCYARNGIQSISAIPYFNLVIEGTDIKTCHDTLQIVKSLHRKVSASLSCLSVKWHSGASLIISGDVLPSTMLASSDEWQQNPDTVIFDLNGSYLARHSLRTKSLNRKSGQLYIDSSSLFLEGDLVSIDSISPLKQACIGIKSNRSFKVNASTARQEWKYIYLELPDDSVCFWSDTLYVSQLLHLAGGKLNASHLILQAFEDSIYSEFKGEASQLVQPLTYYYTLKGQAGWEYLSSPFRTPLSQTGLPLVYSGSGANVYKWNNRTSEWVLPVSSDSIGKQDVYAVYISQHQLPLKLTFRGRPDAHFNHSPFLAYDSSGQQQNFVGAKDGWNLIGNPFTYRIDWSKIQFDSSETVNHYHYMKPRHSSHYLAHNGFQGHSSLNGVILPFKAFFIKLGSSADTSTQSFNWNSNIQANPSFQTFKNRKAFWRISSTKTEAECVITLAGGNAKSVDLRLDAPAPSGSESLEEFLAIKFGNTSPAFLVKSLSDWPVEASLLLYIQKKNSLEAKIETSEPILAMLYDSLNGEWIELSTANKFTFSSSQQYYPLKFKATLPLGIDHHVDNVQEKPVFWFNQGRLKCNLEVNDLSIRELNGRLLYSGSIHDFSINLPQGIYLIEYQSANGLKHSYKILKSSHF